MWAPIERVGVVGCGLMGSGIAEVSARAGTHVVVVEANDDALAAGRHRIQSSLEKAHRRGKLAGSPSDVLDGMVFSTDFSALSDRQLVIEAVVENLDAKLAVFTQLDEVVKDPEAILASNTSSIPVIRLAMATSRPKQVLGMHFFNPVPVMRLVELVTTLRTTEEVVERAAAFAEDVLGKHVVRAKDRAGFIVNALLIPYLLAAIRMVESGFATPEDIDMSMVEGCNHPMGPLALCDLIGLDTVAAVAVSLYEEFKEPLYAPPPLLARMCEAGLLGRKSGGGFYPYER
ncbi:MAG: 3-hydroxybutyryl-CoA dehydrogenase [Actinomycetota bacterium]|nr:3-hydroxybutyryl-CoA dehydrogenase [Actinomycetota bacterium]